MSETDINKTTIMLSWHDPNFIEEGYKVYKYKDSGTDLEDDSVSVTDIPRNSTFFIDDDVTMGEAYYYRVGAYMPGERTIFQKVSKEIRAVAQPIYVYANDTVSVYNITSALDVLWERSSGTVNDMGISPDKSLVYAKNGTFEIDFFNNEEVISFDDISETFTVSTGSNIDHLSATASGKIYINGVQVYDTGEKIYDADFMGFNRKAWIMFYDRVGLFDIGSSTMEFEIPVRSNLRMLASDNRDGVWILDSYNKVWKITRDFHREYRLDLRKEFSVASTTYRIRGFEDGFVVGGTYGIKVYDGDGNENFAISSVGNVKSMDVTPLYDIFVGNDQGYIYRINSEGIVLLENKVSDKAIDDLVTYFINMDDLIEPYGASMIVSRTTQSDSGETTFITGPAINRAYSDVSILTLKELDSLWAPNVFDLPMISQSSGTGDDQQVALQISPSINGAFSDDATYTLKTHDPLWAPNVFDLPQKTSSDADGGVTLRIRPAINGVFRNEITYTYNNPTYLSIPHSSMTVGIDNDVSTSPIILGAYYAQATSWTTL